ncbi:cobalamin biosynthesis protein [Nocardia altamirensis]|uniref:cobalamin biosynthesis protein n=1 Tax=Nocardia altamirensis TaxID=472158 RepID=UPI000A044074|nr:cobalamin biosynthesis protein [Nocardia altamirensis]
MIGLGLRPAMAGYRIVGAVREVLGDQPIGCLATIDRRVADPGLQHAARTLGVAVLTYSAAELAEVPVPNPAARTMEAVGTASVAEAAAILASGGGALIIAKRSIDGIVIAVAQRHSA